MSNRENISLARAAEPVSEEIKLVVLKTEDTDYYEIPVLDGRAISLAISIAEKIQKERRKLLKSNNIIINEAMRLNRKTAYSFVKYMITVSDTQSPVGDLKKHINKNTLVHIVTSLLKQAEDCRLKNTFQYRKLKKQCDCIMQYRGFLFSKKVSNKLFNETNAYIENLYFELSKILH